MENTRIPEPDSATPAGGAIANEVRQELNRILSSDTLGAAEAQKAFLRYVVEQTLDGNSGKIKEYSVATEVFGKNSSFDSRIDPIVRIQAGNLRLRLTKYYETEGREDPIRIELPKGSYTPRFRMQDPSQPISLEEKSVPILTEEENGRVDELQTKSRFKRHKRFVAGVAAIVLLLGAATAWLMVRNSLAAGAKQASVVVIPFTNLSDSREDEFFSDGLTDELIDSLARVPDLRVIGRTSAFQFRGKTIDIREIGERLGVGAVLEGSVRRYGRRLRVTAQLTDSKAATILWSSSYDRDTEDALLVQTEIAQAITLAFRSTKGSTSAAPSRLLVAPTPIAPSAKVQEAYLKARFFWAKNTSESLAISINYLQDAIRQDPNWGYAYIGLAQCYVALPVLTGTPSRDVVPKIEAAALKALDLDPSLGMAHIDLAQAAMYGFDWATAEREFRTGLALSPGSPNGHQSYGNYLLLTGHAAEAVQQDEIALEMDPISTNIAQALAKSLRFAGRLDDSIVQSQKALILDPNYGLTRENLGAAYLQKGMYSEAIREFERARDLLGPRAGPTSHLAYAYARAGRTAEAGEMLNSSLREFAQGSVPATAVARIYLGFQNMDQTVAWLEKAIDRQDVNIFIESDPLYEPLRKDPRFPALLRRMKLAPEMIVARPMP